MKNLKVSSKELFENTEKYEPYAYKREKETGIITFLFRVCLKNLEAK